MTALLSREKLETWIKDSGFFATDEDGEGYDSVIDTDVLLAAIKLGHFSPSSSCQEGSIRSETNCPTCGSAVTVGGDGETHYYIPVSHGGWQPIETAPKMGIIWLANEHSMRLGFWREGKQYECFGSQGQGGGWCDWALSTYEGPSDLRYQPTKWMETPTLPSAPRKRDGGE